MRAAGGGRNGARGAAFALVLFAAGAAAQARPEPPVSYAAELGRAEAWFAANQPRIDAALSRFGLDPAPLRATVFPEVLRYSLFRDRMEIGGLLLLYVEQGERFADFSVGPFQMKPSFAAKVEAAVAGAEGPAARRLAAELSYAEPEGPERRKARVARLSDLDWQLRYLAAFALVLENRYPATPAPFLAAYGDEGRTAFLAAAYNAGFERPPEELLGIAQLRLFPDRSLPEDQKLRYVDLALDYAEGPGRAGDASKSPNANPPSAP